MTKTKPQLLPNPHVVTNAHPVTWSPYTEFHPDWSINTFLADIMTSYGSGNGKSHSVTHPHVVNNAHPVS